MVDQEKGGGHHDHAVAHVLTLVPGTPDILGQGIRGCSNPEAVLHRQKKANDSKDRCRKKNQGIPERETG